MMKKKERKDRIKELEDEIRYTEYLRIWSSS